MVLRAKSDEFRSRDPYLRPEALIPDGSDTAAHDSLVERLGMRVSRLEKENSRLLRIIRDMTSEKNADR